MLGVHRKSVGGIVGQDGILPRNYHLWRNSAAVAVQETVLCYTSDVDIDP